MPWAKGLRVNLRGADGMLEPEVVRLSRCLSELGPIDLDDPDSWDLRVTAQERSAAETALAGMHEPFIAINMGGKVAPKDWGASNWAELLAQLSRRVGDHAVVAVGAAEDAEQAAQVLKAWAGTTRNLCGHLSPRQNFHVLSRARLFIGHDSGPLHLAAAAQTPCVGLFGSYNEPRMWHPYGRNHRVIHRQSGVRDIRVEEVIEQVVAALAQNELLPEMR
jgi:heptosyltransferase-3